MRKRTSPLLTIFTPTYNRAYLLPRLYESLKKQTRTDFEWIIVNDGSTDITEKLVRGFLKDGIVDITYRFTENGGKMRAVNHGVRLAKGDYFFIVDSDDYITSDCVEKILFAAETLPENMGGIAFKKAFGRSESVRVHNKPFSVYTFDSVHKPFPVYTFDSNPAKVFRDRILGDKAEVIRTRLLAENPFPEIQGEKFVPEGYVWNKIGEKHGFRYINEEICVCQYLSDGYTNNFGINLRKNPKGFALYYSDMLRYDIPALYKAKFLIRLLQCWCYRIQQVCCRLL